MLATVVVMAAAVMSALADMGVTAVERVRAQTTADAAALASLDGGRAVAAALAGKNGGVLVSWRHETDGTVVAVVRVGDATATARATDVP